MLLATMFGMHPFLRNLFADTAYQGPGFHKGLARILPHLETEIVKRSDHAKGFKVLPSAGSSSAQLRGSIVAASPGLGRNSPPQPVHAYNIWQASTGIVSILAVPQFGQVITE